MENRRLKTTEVAPARDILLKKQDYTCPLCKGRMRTAKDKTPVLDHDHKTGFVRDVLCLNCNGIEGKVFNLARRARNGGTEIEWIERLLAYWRRHEKPQHGGVWHPTHRTEAEKRLARNKKAREKRAALKEK